MKRLILAIMTIVACASAFAQSELPLDDLKTVYKDENVIFRKIDRHTWVGTGNQLSSETLYLLEGKDRALLIDAGTKIPGLDKIVAKITKKPVTLVLTHSHPDHAGATGCFDEVWVHPADAPTIRFFAPDFNGTVRHLENGQLFELGGRTIETYFTPGHTPGSTTFLEVGKEYGYSGDSFGNGHLLVCCEFKTLIKTCQDSYEYFSKKGYKKFYCGHFSGTNFETLDRIKLIETMSEEVLEGKVEAEVALSYGNINRSVLRDGFRLNYNDEALKKEIEAQK